MVGGGQEFVQDFFRVGKILQVEITVTIDKNHGYKKRFFENSTSLTLHRGSENLKIPIIRSKMKVVVNFIYGYQNLSGEKYKTDEKRISSIEPTSFEKNPVFQKSGILGGFWDFSQNW